MIIIHTCKNFCQESHGGCVLLTCLKAMHANADKRLACQCWMMGDVEVVVDEP